MSLTGLQKFYGRKTILEVLRKRVIDFKDGYRQNVALTGFRHIGKTFVVQKFLSEVRSPDLIQIYIDAECTDIHHFCNRIAGSVLYEFLKIRLLPVHGNLDILIETTHKLLPGTTAAIKKAQKYLHHGKHFEAYKEMIALPQVFSSETGLFCLFVLDEFQSLEEWGFENIFQELGKVIMTQKQCLYIFGSSYPEQANMVLSEKLSLLFGNFEIIEVKALDVKACQAYVDQHLSGLCIREDLRDFLIDFNGGHPLYLKLLCDQLRYLASAHHQQEIFIPILSRAVEDVLFDPWGVLSRHFDLMMQQLCCGKGNMINAGMLRLLSGGKQKARDISEKLLMKQSSLSPRLKRLQDEGIVARMGRSFYVHDRLLRYWLFYVFRRRWEAVDVDPESQREQFRQEFARGVDEFRLQSRKTMPVRIIELLSCFDDEAFQSGGRRYKLPVFDKIDSERITQAPGADFHVIRALTLDGSVWLVLLKDGAVEEHDLTRVVTQVKKESARPQRCILLALNELDETVRVRALQERMWIWNEDELRTLLHVYNKPYIAAP